MKEVLFFYEYQADDQAADIMHFTSLKFYLIFWQDFDDYCMSEICTLLIFSRDNVLNITQICFSYGLVLAVNDMIYIFIYTETVVFVIFYNTWQHIYSIFTSLSVKIKCYNVVCKQCWSDVYRSMPHISTPLMLYAISNVYTDITFRIHMIHFHQWFVGTIGASPIR